MTNSPVPAAAHSLFLDRQSLHHRVTAELRAQGIDRVLGFGRARVDEIGEVVTERFFEVAQSDADQPEARGADFVAQKVASGRKDARR